MHLTSFTLPLALLASLVTASPLEARGPRADEGSKRTTGMSKYSDFNELVEPRRLPSLHVCTDWNCGGSCSEYFFTASAGECVGTVSFRSAYVYAEGVLNFGVNVGHECDSGLCSSDTPPSMPDILHLDSVTLSNLNTCYNAGGDAYYTS